LCSIASPSFIPIHDRADLLSAEHAQEIILEREVELRGSWIPLAPRPSEKLIIDAPRLVPLAAHHVEAAELRDALAKLDVRAASRHVRGDGDDAQLAGLGDDLRLLLVVLGVQDVMRQLARLQQVRHQFRYVDRVRPHEDGAALLVQTSDFVGRRLELGLARSEERVGLRVAAKRLIGRDGEDRERVDLLELLFLGLRGSRHAAESLVELKVVLQRDLGQRLRLALDRNALFRLQRLVQAVRVPPIGHEAAGELVDDHDAVFSDDVLLLPVEHVESAQRVLDVMLSLDVVGRKEVLHAELALRPVDALIGQGEALRFLVDFEVLVAAETPCERREFPVQVVGLGG
jgi:hypothetical protein